MFLIEEIVFVCDSCACLVWISLLHLLVFHEIFSHLFPLKGFDNIFYLIKEDLEQSYQYHDVSLCVCLVSWRMRSEKRMSRRTRERDFTTRNINEIRHYCYQGAIKIYSCEKMSSRRESFSMILILDIPFHVLWSRGVSANKRMVQDMKSRIRGRNRDKREEGCVSKEIQREK